MFFLNIKTSMIPNSNFQGFNHGPSDPEEDYILLCHYAFLVSWSLCLGSSNLDKAIPSLHWTQAALILKNSAQC